MVARHRRPSPAHERVEIGEAAGTAQLGEDEVRFGQALVATRAKVRRLRVDRMVDLLRQTTMCAGSGLRGALALHLGHVVT